VTTPPLPDVPAIRVRLDYTDSDSFQGGSRLFFQYSGGPPSTSDLDAVITEVLAAYSTNFAPLIHSDWTLSEIDVLDIASNSGNSKTRIVSEGGGYTGATLPSSAAVNIEYDIARRYRGGKPRMFAPPPGNTAMTNAAEWLPAFQTQWNNAFAAFVTAVLGGSYGSITLQHHINLSYYSGFTNVTNSSGRTRAAPKYRATAKSDIITGYNTRQVIGSQRRRRTATTP
jgi:hypothetical protein